MATNNQRIWKHFKMATVTMLIAVLLAGCGAEGGRLKVPDSPVKVNPDGGMDPDVNTATIDFSRYGFEQDE